MISTADYQDALEPIARKAFFLGAREVDGDLRPSTFFDVGQSDKLTETYLEEGDIGATEDLTGSLAFDDMSQGYKGTITAVEKAKGLKIQKKFLRTDQLGIAKSRPRMLGLSARRRISSDTFYMFNHAFDGLVTSLDGVTLCSASHTSNQEDGSTQSNTGTSTFNAVNLTATRLNMKKFLTNRDQKFEVRPNTIICPVDIEDQVWEVANSMGKLDTANNNKNFHASQNWRVISSVWLDDTNNWFVVDSELMKQFNKWNVLDKLDFKQADEFSSFAALYASYMFYGFGTTDWRWIYGHAVS